ncbi:MAG: M23 family metallopeptidase [Candidatus Hydrogenedentes bacterium]|nr:M23 family metallopeptidase [Candidatus Hydrogenedentota bacterium]
MRIGAARGSVIVGVCLLFSVLSGCAGHREVTRTTMVPARPPAPYLYYLEPRLVRVPDAAPTTQAPEPAPVPAVSTPEGWPVDHPDRKVISTYGARRSIGGGKSRLHRGIDIKAPFGAPVVATADGVVTLSGVQDGYGHIVVVDHGNGRATAYAHLSTRTVAVGDAVHKGDRVGQIGRTGRATTPHLHYEVRIEGKAVDPASYLPPA